MRTVQQVTLNLSVTTKNGETSPLSVSFQVDAGNMIVSTVLKSWDSDFLTKEDGYIVPIDSSSADSIRRQFFGEDCEIARVNVDE